MICNKDQIKISRWVNMAIFKAISRLQDREYAAIMTQF